MKKIIFALLIPILVTSAFCQNEFFQSENNYEFEPTAIVLNGSKTAKVFVADGTWGVDADKKLAITFSFDKFGFVENLKKTDDFEITFQALETGTTKEAKLTYTNETLKSAEIKDQYDNIHNIVYEKKGKKIVKQTDNEIDESFQDFGETTFTYNEKEELTLIETKNMSNGKNLGTFYKIYSYPTDSKMVVEEGTGKIRKSSKKQKNNISSKDVFEYNKNGTLASKSHYSDFVGDYKEVKLEYTKNYTYDEKGRLIEIIETPSLELGKSYGYKSSISKKETKYFYEDDSKIIEKIVSESFLSSDGKMANKTTLHFEYFKY